jgi:hydrogenase expression/formation protein HypC
MCLAVPGQVIGLVEGNDQLAHVDVLGTVRTVNVGILASRPGPGDWLIIHSGFALEKVSAAGAESALGALRLLGLGEETAQKQPGG